MRLIIQPDYQSVSLWAAHYVAAKIKAANPTPEKPFVLGCPTGSSPPGTKNCTKASLTTTGWATLENKSSVRSGSRSSMLNKSSSP